MPDKKDQNNSGQNIEKLINSGAEITGGAVGSIIGFFMGGFVGAAIGGAGSPIVVNTFKKIANEIKERLIGPREEKRIGAAIYYAVEKIQTNLKAGKILRTDDFFNSSPDERSSADEILEATLLAAQREYQEKKLKYYGNLIGNIAFNNTFDRSQANHLIKTAQELSWQQLCLLALSVKKLSFALKVGSWRGQTSFTQSLIFLLHEIQDLYNRGLINFGGEVLLGLPDVEPSKMTAQGVGAHLYNTMELFQIPNEELLPIATLLK